jgi:hypothetical protein
MVPAGIPSGCVPFAPGTGGIAGAQPPANRCDASGIGHVISCDSGLLVDTPRFGLSGQMPRGDASGIGPVILCDLG